MYLLFSVDTLCAVCAKCYAFSRFCFMCVFVCVTKKRLFTHLLVKSFREKDAYCLLIYFIGCQRCLLDLHLLGHAECAVSLVFIIAIVPQGLFGIF